MGKRKTGPRISDPPVHDTPVEKPEKKKGKKDASLSAAERDAALLAQLKKQNEELDIDDNDEVLEFQYKKWTREGGAECYSHYKPPVIIIVDGIVKYKFVCIRHPSKAVSRACYDTSTSNLVNHAKGCDPGANIIKKYTTGGDYNVGRFRMSLAQWIAVRNRLHAAVKDAELVQAFRTLQPNVHVPSDNTVGRDIKQILKIMQPHIIQIFKDHDGVFHAMLDGWTSANVLSIVGLVLQWVDDNQLRNVLIEMIPSPHFIAWASHTRATTSDEQYTTCSRHTGFRGLELQPALDRLCLTSTGRASIKSLLLSNDEWQLISQMAEVLIPFKDATMRVSSNKHPRIFEVIPLIDILNEHLEDVAKQEHADVFVHEQDPKAAKDPKMKSKNAKPKQRPTFVSVRVSAVRALGVVDKYYSKTDDSIMYRAGLLLHPCYGKAYMRRVGWELEWIETAVGLLRTQWRTNYRDEGEDDEISIVPKKRSKFDVLDAVPVHSDPFEHFINSEPIAKGNCEDPILWWGTQSPYSSVAARKKKNNVVLIRMAQDFLGAPATSVEIERVFSHSGGMVTKRRHAFSAETIRANSLVAAWSKGGWVPEQEVVAALGSKQSRKKKQNVVSLDSDGDEEEEDSGDDKDASDNE
uniref:HAT C-terminal dimerisation domain-containing protein n=1 Tax=Mycena chlorophos TaxID=658473 RepID=A0ABQ0L1K3_MYCCL|nr:predicted protein [Mycena chlorophos]